MRSTPAWAVTAVACAAQFLVVLDVSIVNVALPAIRSELGFGATGLEWIVNAYALTFAGLLLLGGRAADAFGSSRMFAIGLTLFTAASLVGGIAVCPEMLVAARAAQGVGAGLLSPVTLAVLLTAFPDGPRRASALASWSAVGAMGGAAGSLLGGVLTDTWSWRLVFLINIPVGALILTLCLVALPRAHGDGGRLDVTGAATGTFGLAALAYGLSAWSAWGWDSWLTICALGVAAFSLSCFVASQTGSTAHRLLPLEIFRIRSFARGNALMLLAGAVIFPLWYLVSLYLQEVQGLSALRTGLAFLPHTVALVAGARLGPLLLRVVGPRLLIATGAATASAGFLWHSLLTDTSPLLSGVILPGSLACLGIALTFTPLTLTATGGVGPDRAGLASGVLNTARQVGGAVGLAALAGFAVDELRTAFLACATVCLTMAIASRLLPPVDREED